MSQSQFLDHLISIGACSEARRWVSDNSLTATQAWQQCQRPDWLLWWTGRTPVNTHQAIVLTACKFARSVLHLVPEGETRPRLAIEAAERWAQDPTEVNLVLVRQARAAATAAIYATTAAAYAAVAAAYAANSAAAAAAAANADAAIYATTAATYAADSADSADYAADSAAAAGAANGSRSPQCRIIRESLIQPWTEPES